jgi:hypothetical protein
VKALHGEEVVLANLIAAAAALKVASLKGCMRAGVLVRREALKLTPYKYGELARSSYGPKPVSPTTVEIGYSAEYAPYVHEIEKRNYTKPGTGWKYLERALIQNGKRVLELMAGEAKLR